MHAFFTMGTSLIKLYELHVYRQTRTDTSDECGQKLDLRNIRYSTDKTDIVRGRFNKHR